MFGDLPLDRAEGAILAHSLRAGTLALNKGRMLTAADLAALHAAGIATVTAARLEPGDIHEDAAAARLARALRGDNLSASAARTGRVNLFAEAKGLAAIDRDRLDRINRLDEALTVATLPEFAPVEPGQMVATIKIIPFAAPDTVLEEAERIAAEAPPIRVAPFRARRAVLIQTRLPGLKPVMLDKTAQVTARRLAALGCTLVAEWRCEHATGALAAELDRLAIVPVDLVLIAGASAITDRRDVLPAAIEAAGGRIGHFGMPVDPGNLLLLAHRGTVPILGLPGCARSPRLNGLDWVLQRLAADLPIGQAEIMGMGVGGLLTEISGRPLPRARATAPEERRPPRIAAIVLAAGQSRRMGAANKLLCPVEGRPMVRWAVEAALGSRADPVIVVTGHRREAVAAALAGLPVRLVDNPDHAEGLSGSLRAGLAAVPAEVEGAVICLGDMPRITAGLLDRLIAAYDPAAGRTIVVPTRHGRRGNPVVWDRRFFAEMQGLSGDTGARALLVRHAAEVAELEAGDDAVLLDIDTPEALATLTGTATAP